MAYEQTTARSFSIRRIGRKEPTREPEAYFSDVDVAGSAVLQHLNWKALYDDCHRGRWIEFERQQLFFRLGGNDFIQEGVIHAYATSPPADLDIGRANRLVEALKPARWWWQSEKYETREGSKRFRVKITQMPIVDALRLLADMQDRCLEWLFEEEILEVYAWSQGAWVPASYALITKDEESAAAATTRGAKELAEEPPQRKKGQGRKHLVLDALKRNLAREARRHLAKGMHWPEIRSLCGGYDRRTLQRCIKMLEDEERQTTVN